MKKKFVVIFSLCLALMLAGCGGLLSDLKEETLETESSLEGSISLAPENSSQPTEPEPEGPETDEDIPEAPNISSSVLESSPSENNSEAASGKLEFVYTLDDERVQFRSDTEVVGTEEELQKCRDVFEIDDADLGKLVIYSENRLAYYSDEFIDDILSNYRRTTLHAVDEITEQDPRALTRGISMAAFYDKEGNRICLSKWYGHLFWIELQDSENILVFKGTLGQTEG